MKLVKLKKNFRKTDEKITYTKRGFTLKNDMLNHSEFLLQYSYYIFLL